MIINKYSSAGSTLFLLNIMPILKKTFWIFTWRCCFKSFSGYKSRKKRLKSWDRRTYYWNSPALVQRCCFSDCRLNRDRWRTTFGWNTKKKHEKGEKRVDSNLPWQPYTSNSSHVYARIRDLCHRNTSNQSVSCANFVLETNPTPY